MNKYTESYQRLTNRIYKYDHIEDVYKDLEVLGELVDKATPKKPSFEGDGYADNGEIDYDTWICPNCETKYEVDYQEYDCCPNCGQRIDWSEETEE